MRKKVISVLLAVIIILTGFVPGQRQTVYAESENDTVVINDETTSPSALSALVMPLATSASSGNFIAPIDPPDPNAILIHNAQELNEIINDLSASYRLVNDIDYTGIGDWIPIDNFTGSFDGQGYIIQGLPRALFRSIRGASVKNVGLIGGTGNLIQTAYSESEITNSFNARNTADASSNGGICSTINGYVQISYCYNTGSVSAYRIAGGIVGSAATGSLPFIEYSYNTGNVSVNNTFEDPAPHTAAGGIIGFAENGVNISNSYNTGNISNYSTGRVIYNTRTKSGGIVGTLSHGGRISNCYTTGSITCSSNPNTSFSIGTISGGIVPDDPTVQIKNCVVLSSPIRALGYETTAWMIGVTSFQNKANCLALSSTQLQAVNTSDDSNGRISVSESRQRSTYENIGWDFQNTWAIDSAINNGLPYFTKSSSQQGSLKISTDGTDLNGQIKVNDKLALTATIYDENGNAPFDLQENVTWTVSDPSIVSYELLADYGICSIEVTGLKEGQVAITAINTDGLSGSIRIEVIGNKRIEILPKDIDPLKTGEDINLYATIYDDNNQPLTDQSGITWTKSNDNVELLTTVNEPRALVEALKPGKTIISASTVDGLEDSVEIVVVDAQPWLEMEFSDNTEINYIKKADNTLLEIKTDLYINYKNVGKNLSDIPTQNEKDKAVAQTVYIKISSSNNVLFQDDGVQEVSLNKIFLNGLHYNESGIIGPIEATASDIPTDTDYLEIKVEAFMDDIKQEFNYIIPILSIEINMNPIYENNEFNTQIPLDITISNPSIDKFGNNCFVKKINNLDLSMDAKVMVPSNETFTTIRLHAGTIEPGNNYYESQNIKAPDSVDNIINPKKDARKIGALFIFLEAKASNYIINNNTYTFNTNADRFSFINPTHPDIKYDYYTYLWGDTVFARWLSLTNTLVNFCWGMCITDVYFKENNDIINSYLISGKNSENKTAKYISDLNLSSTSNKFIIDNLEELLNIMHLTQLDVKYIRQDTNNKNKIEEIYEKTNNYQQTGNNPIVIGVSGKDTKGKIKHHSILALRVVNYSTGSRIYVYDVNHPMDECYLTINRIGDSWEWEYTFFDNLTWGTNIPDSEITYREDFEQCFNYISTVNESRNLRIESENENFVLLTSDNPNFSIINSTGRSAIYSDGYLSESSIDNIYPITVYDLAKEGITNDTKEYVSMYIPYTEYIVTAENNEATRTTMLACNTQIDVTAPGKISRRISVSDNNINDTYAIIDSQGEEVPFSIIYSHDNQIAKNFNEISINGIASSPVRTQEIENGVKIIGANELSLHVLSDSSSWEKEINNISSQSDITVTVMEADGLLNLIIKADGKIIDEPVESNATLLSLTINKGTLFPDFNPYITNYTASVPNSLSEITINATSTDSSAKVTGIGIKTLVVGENRFEITVTAANDVRMIYTIIIKRLTETLTPSPSATTTPSPSATTTPSPSATATPSPSVTVIPSPSAIATPSPSATAAPSPSVTVTPSPSAIATPSPSAIATPSATTTPSPSAIATPSPSATTTPSPSATATPSPSATTTPSPSATATPLSTALPTKTTMPTLTPQYNSGGYRTYPAEPPTIVTPTLTPPISPSKMTVILSIDSKVYTKNGVQADFDVAPYIDSSTNRTMVPIRFIAEAFGASVNWQDDIKTDFIYLDGKSLSIALNQPLPNDMGTAVLVKDRLFVPVRYVSEQLGAKVDWNEATKTVTINFNNPVNLAGGYSADRSVTDEDLKVFNEAMNGLVGVSYKPTLVATQVVAGTNYRFTTTATPVVPNPVPFKAYVYIFKPLQGPTQLKEIVRG